MAEKNSAHPAAERDLPIVSVIIPHLKGLEILQRCLRALRSCTYSRLEIILVDNGSSDGSSDHAGREYSVVKLVKSPVNLGYAAGCNLGLKYASGKYALLLNDDAEVTHDFLEPLVACMEADSRIGGCQPKIRAIQDRQSFDYAGAAGGFMDIYGYPFCRGRIFVTIEEDCGQYDRQTEIFWASGACCLLRMSTLEETGGLDEDFFAHMEEIDLQWRMWLAGYRIVCVSSSTVFHQAGSTLVQDTPGKVFLNHRNGLVMLLKNHRFPDLAKTLPVRLTLELAELFYRLVRGEFRNAIAIVRAFGSVLLALPSTLRKRTHAGHVVNQDLQTITPMYRRSIVWDYFVNGRKMYSDLPLSGSGRV